MLTIGEFSKLSHVSSRMLRYYNSMGLLCPAHMGKENGYRYYDTLLTGSVHLPMEHVIRSFGTIRTAPHFYTEKSAACG